LSLENLSGPNQSLVKEPPDAKEFAGLLEAARRSLVDAKRKENSDETRFLLAYQTAHAYSLAALRHCGYRPKNRFIVFQTLPHTLGLGPEIWRVLSKAHDLRNLAEYEGHFEVTVQLLEDVIAAAETVAAAVARLRPL